MPEPQLEDQAIFEVARNIDSPEARETYIHQMCGEDLALEQRVKALLQAFEESESFLESPPSELELAATRLEPVSEQVGTQIGPFKLLQQIGEGGMGVVYMAEQTVPVERRVALKVIKPGMDTRTVIARFEAERQALAMMDHPGIAKVLDAGTTKSGHPYFVMELVKGVPITQYCDDHQLTPRQRLELFIPVCQAVQHAHQKGIIHRDLKPSNVLVTQYDDRPVPKVIDFGVAKAIENRLTVKTMFTELGQMIGTVDYMSPEQTKLNQLDIDTRSDIYSLGVMLYELLTGNPPFDRGRLRSAAIDEVMRIIREEDPPKPSVRLSTVETLPSVAANRHIEPRELTRQLRGEVDWIVMKALEKDRTRRYDTANGLADDVRRYLDDEPVLACPPTTAYRARKFAKKNKLPIAVTVTASLLLILVAVSSTVAASRFRELADDKAKALIAERDAKNSARESQRQAENARNQERFLRQEAQQQRLRAESNLDLALETLDTVYLESIQNGRYDISGLANYVGVLSYPGDIGSALTEKERESLQLSLGFYEQFAESNSDSLKTRQRTAQAYFRTGLLYQRLGEILRANDAFEVAVDLYRKMMEDGYLDDRLLMEFARALHAFSHVRPVTESRPLLEEAHSVCTQAIENEPADPGRFLTRARIRDALYRKDSIDDYRTVVQLDPQNSTALMELAICTGMPIDRTLYDLDQAVLYAERAIRIAPNDPRALYLAGNFSARQGNREQSLEYFERSLKTNPNFSPSLCGIAYQHHSQMGEHERAIEIATKAVEGAPYDPWAIYIRGFVYAKAGRPDLALSDFQAAEILWPDWPAPILARADELLRRCDYEAAIAAYSIVIERTNGTSESALYGRAEAYEAIGDQHAAEQDLTKATEIFCNLKSYVNRAAFYQRINDRDAELADLTKTTELAHTTTERTHDIQWHLSRSAKRLVELGEFDLATSIYKGALDRDPHREVFIGRGDYYRDASQLELAIADYTSAIAVDPTHARTYTRRASVYERTASFQKAIEDYEKAFELGRCHDTAPLVRCFRMLGSVEEAVTGIRQRIAREPENAFLQELVGHVLRDLKRYPEAADSYEAALDIEPGREWAQLWLGHCRHQLGDDERARHHVHAVLESRPADHEFIRCRAHRLKELQEYERAAIDFESGFRIWDGSAGHRYAASIAHFKAGQYTKALADLQRAFQLDSDNVTIPAGILPELASGRGDPPFRQGLLALVDQVVASDNQKRATLLLRSQLLAEIGHADRALKDLTAVIDADTARSGEDPQSSPGSDECYQRYLAALLCLQLEDQDAYRKAVGDLQRRFETAEDASSQNFVAWTACLAPAAVADYSTVLALAEKAVAAEPENDQFQKTLAAARFRSGQHDAARELLLEIAERDEKPNAKANSSPAYGWYFLVMTEQALGNSDEAKRFLDKANDWTGNILSDEENPPAWNRKLTLELLRDEATAVIENAVHNQPIQSAEESTTEIKIEQ